MSSVIFSLKSSAIAVAIASGALSTPLPPDIDSSGIPSVASGSSDVSFSDFVDELQGSDSSKSVVAPQGEIAAGIDVSSHQHMEGPVNWDDVKSGYNDFAFIKSTEGVTYKNPHNSKDVSKALSAGLTVGEYHYARPDLNDAKSEANHFLSNMSSKTTLPPVLDIEESNLEPGELVEWIDEWVTTVENSTGQQVMIYTYPNFWREKTGNSTKFSSNPLWIADYNGKSAPSSPLPGGWDDWAFWQYTDKGSSEGVAGDVDLNIFNGKISSGD